MEGVCSCGPPWYSDGRKTGSRIRLQQMHVMTTPSTSMSTCTQQQALTMSVAGQKGGDV